MSIRRLTTRTLGALATAAVALWLMGAAQQASALQFSVGLDTEFSGATAPAGTAPWVTVTFKDVGTDTVRMTLDTGGLSGTEFMSEFYFNNFNFTTLTATEISNTGSMTWSLFQGVDSFKADGDGKFDYKLDFGNTFTAGETLVIDFTAIDLEALDFNTLSFTGTNKTGLLVAAHIQSIGPTGDDSGWITGDGKKPPQVSEPASLMLFASGLLGLGFVARRRRRPAAA